MKRTAALSVLALACARQGPQVMTPVRIDAAPVPVSSAPAVAPPAATTGMPEAGWRVSDNPLHRIDRSDWPGPNRYRDGSGAPGPEYWQQRADYTITATLDTGAKSIAGRVTIRYTNNSPDSLHFVWLQLDQNLYGTGSKGSLLYPAEGRWGVRGFHGGYEIAGLQVDGRTAVGKVDDTMMRVDLDSPIPAHGGAATISLAFSFRVPVHGSDRMGRDSALYEIAQWYPRLAVYDDVRGWNTDPYLGQGEFYLEYGDIDYTVTVPAGFVVAGSGVLENPEVVLTAAQRERLNRAIRSTVPTPIITEPEAAAAKTKSVGGTRSWHFRADHVRDVAWAAAPDFRWDAVGTGAIDGNATGALCNAYYEFPKAGRAWESGAEMCQWTIRTYTQLWFPYPYPQATAVAGPVGGMEYPMFVMVHYGSNDPTSIFGTVDHELGHQWYPMVVGSNERRYAWMDEGLNTYINAFSSERRYPGTTLFGQDVGNWRQAVDAKTDSPLMTPPDQIDPAALGAVGYRKPAAVLLTLRDVVVGRETMDRALREYTRRWAFKHPTPGDFFRTVENVAGEDLSWFWTAFFYRSDVLDIGIENVTTRQAQGQSYADIALRRNTPIPFPVSMRLKFADGTTQDFQLPVEIWARTNRYTASVPVKGAVTGVRLWPDPDVPDWDPSNDTWGDAPPPTRGVSSTAGGLGTPIGVRRTASTGASAQP